VNARQCLGQTIQSANALEFRTLITRRFNLLSDKSETMREFRVEELDRMNLNLEAKSVARHCAGGDPE